MPWIATSGDDGQFDPAGFHFVKDEGVQVRANAAILVVRMHGEQFNLAGCLVAIPVPWLRVCR